MHQKSRVLMNAQSVKVLLLQPRYKAGFMLIVELQRRIRMLKERMLRSAGDFPNKTVVEYATVAAKLLHRDLPSNLQDKHCTDESMVSLSFSPTGRLTYKELFLDSVELANAFAEHLKTLVDKRSYNVEISVSVQTSTWTKRTTAKRKEHSEIVRRKL